MTFTPLPSRLETARLVLTPEVDDDAPWFAHLLTARGVGVVTVDQARERIQAMHRTTATTGIGALVLRRKGDDEPLGYCAIVVGRSTLEEPEVAYELLPRFHGHGYATEASAALVEAAFATGRTRLWSTVRSWNVASLRVLEKLAFRRHHRTWDTDGEILWHVRDADGRRDP